MDNPTPIADVLEQQVERMAASQPHTEPAPAAPAPVEGGYTRAEYEARRDAHRWAEILPARYHDASLDDLPEPEASILAEWAADPAGRNVIFAGPVGTGKSHAAAATLRATGGHRVRFLPVVELLDLLRPGGPEDIMDELVDLDVLVVDDIGSERPTEWTSERLYSLINRRWLEMLPVIVTSNMTAPDLRERIGERQFSRILGNDSIVIKLTGSDKRRTASAK